MSFWGWPGTYWNELVGETNDSRSFEEISAETAQLKVDRLPLVDVINRQKKELQRLLVKKRNTDELSRAIAETQSHLFRSFDLTIGTNRVQLYRRYLETI